MNDANPYSPPEDQSIPGAPTVTVEISEAWVRSINSWKFTLVSALSGVSVTFAPIGLLGLGSWDLAAPARFLLAIPLLLIVYFVPLYYFRLSSDVIRQVHSGKSRVNQSLLKD
ncbi:MAG: hypothetical protein R3C49_22635 [Planctomycetaceae bacterium]